MWHKRKTFTCEIMKGSKFRSRIPSPHSIMYLSTLQCMIYCTLTSFPSLCCMSFCVIAILHIFQGQGLCKDESWDYVWGQKSVGEFTLFKSDIFFYHKVIYVFNNHTVRGTGQVFVMCWFVCSLWWRAIQDICMGYINICLTVTLKHCMALYRMNGSANRNAN